MRNLKKVLSLVLCLAMVLGLMVVGAGAAFTDEKDIVNKEAVAVTSAIGVIRGTNDGSTFEPNKTLTRAEAATMAARMLQGPENADKLTTSSDPFTDVKADNWAAGYIAYCAAQDILAGTGNGTYKPNDILTVSAFAKIMVCALGYDAEIEGLVGSAWAVNAARLAQDTDLMDGINQGFNDDMTRDSAAQMMLNTLKATMVEYDSKGTTVSTSDGTVVKTDASAAKDKENKSSSTDGNIEKDGLMQFAEKYFDDLKYTEKDNGDYGRPDGFTWSNDDEDDIYTGNDTDTLKGSYTEAAGKNDLYKLIGTSNARKVLSGDYELEVWVDGVKQDPVDARDYFANSGTDDAKGSDDGILTEVYFDSDSGNEKCTIIQIHTYLAQATKNYDTKNETLNVAVYPKGDTSTKSYTIDNDDFAVSGYSKDDWLLVTLDAGDIASVAPVNTITGSVTAYSANSSVTVDGQKYNYSSDVNTKEFTNVTGSFKIDSSTVLLLDDNNYVLGYDEAESDDSYVFVKNAGTANSRSDTIYADLTFPDGTTVDDAVINEVEDINGNTYDDGDGTYNLKNNVATVLKNGWYTYTETSSGDYNLEQITTTAATDVEYQVAISGDSARNGTDNVIKFLGAWSSSKFTSADKYSSTGNAVRADSNTVFVVYDKNKDVKAYTGYSKVPEINKAGDGKVSFNIVVNDDGNAAYVYINAYEAGVKSTSTTNDVVFIYGTAKTGKDANNDTIYTYSNALLNGNKEDVIFTVDGNKPVAAGGMGLYRDITMDGDYVDDATLVKASDKDGDEHFYMIDIGSTAAADADVYVGDGILTIKGDSLGMNSDAEFYAVIKQASGSYSYDSSYDLGDMDDDGIPANSKVFFALDDDDNIKGIYLLSEGFGGTTPPPAPTEYTVSIGTDAVNGLTATVSPDKVTAAGNVTVTFAGTATAAGTMTIKGGTADVSVDVAVGATPAAQTVAVPAANTTLAVEYAAAAPTEYTVSIGTDAVNGLTAAVSPDKVTEAGNVTVTFTGTATAAGTMTIAGGTADVTVTVAVGDTPATQTVAVPAANTTLTVTFTAAE